MQPEPGQERGGRALVIVAALLFAGLPVWLGLGLRRSPTPRAVDGGAMRAEPPVTMQRALRMVSGPSLQQGAGGRLYVTWRTSLPADSFITFGRADAVERIAVKDTALVTDHRFVLPDDPYIGFSRLHVMSVAEGGESVSAELGPGVGRGGAAFQLSADGSFADLGSVDAYAWADYDQDGHLEAATCGPATGLRGLAILGPRGPEWRASAGEGDAGAGCAALHWADMNADGRPDMVCMGSGVSVRLNEGAAPAADELAWRSGELALLAATVCDMNADGLPDVVGLGHDDALHVLTAVPGDPPTFSELLVELPDREGTGVGPVVIAADFTGDQRPDILAGAGCLVLLAGSEDGFEVVDGALPSPLVRPGSDSWLEPADWNSDGHVDLLLARGGEPGRIALLQNDGWGRFHEPAETGELPRTGLPATCGAWGDLDGNGLPDLVLGTAGDGILVYLNAGDDGFMDATSLCRLPLREGLAVRSLSLPDIDGDAAPDIVVGAKARAFLLLNRWRPAADNAFLKVVPGGSRGLSGCTAALLDDDGHVRTSARLPGRGSGRATGPAEFCFGVVGVNSCTARLSLSHRERITRPWERGRGPGRLVLTGGTGVLPPP
jgi:hypothetical protein